jgi:hypothetical protein
MRFLRFVLDGQRIEQRKADAIASAVYPVTDEAYHLQDPESQMELVTERFHGWLPGLFPPRRQWVTPVISDDAYPLRFDHAGYRLKRPDAVLARDEAAAHELTHDVAMTDVQKSSDGNIWNVPLSLMIIIVSVAFLAAVIGWMVMGDRTQ